MNDETTDTRDSQHDDTVPQWLLERINHRGKLDLRGQDLGGKIPPWVYLLTDLRVLRLDGCGLTGLIPAELGGLTNLTHLRLDRNELSGSIPAELGGLTNLMHLGLNGNELSGSIPAELGGLANLTHLWLNGNALSGSIPAELGGLTNLTHLRLERNELSGSIPAELGGLNQLSELGLVKNNLAGRVPGRVRALRELTYLSLDDSLRLRDLSAYHRELVERSRTDSDDDLAGLIAAGESKTVEFKSTPRVNLDTGERDKRMEHTVLKNIAAFLNTDGGTLIIGVDDDGKPLGLDNDGFASEDKMSLHLSQIVNNQIGESVWTNVHLEFATYRGKRVFAIRCDGSDFPVYVGKKEEFYVRTGPSARPLETAKAIGDYIQRRFSRSAPSAEDAPGDGA